MSIGKDEPRGLGWNLRLHLIYYPFFWLVTVLFLWAAATFPMTQLRPAAVDGFLFDFTGNHFLAGKIIFAAILPLSLLLAPFCVRLLIQMIEESSWQRSSYNDRDSRAGGIIVLAMLAVAFIRGRRIFFSGAGAPRRVSPAFWILSLAWLAVLWPVAFTHYNQYFSLGASEIVSDKGGFAMPRRHNWEDVVSVKASCAGAEDAQKLKAAYVLSFRDGSDADIMTENPNDFFAAYPKIAQALAAVPYTYAADVSRGCPPNFAFIFTPQGTTGKPPLVRAHPPQSF